MYHNRYALASGRQRPGILLHIMQCLQQPFKAKDCPAPNVGNVETEEFPYKAGVAQMQIFLFFFSFFCNKLFAHET